MTTTLHITTADQLLRHASELGPCELFAGQLIHKKFAGFDQGCIGSTIASAMYLHAKHHRLGVVTSADTGFLLRKNPDTVLAPDTAFVARARIPAHGIRGYFPGPPDLAVEVRSPRDTIEKARKKAKLWIESGCRLAWLIDPEPKAAYVFRPGAAKPLVLKGDVALDGEEVLPGFKLALGDVFEC
ncbi:MAG: Uma2 family endonuclease [Phycisphaeraceae bacterium]